MYMYIHSFESIHSFPYAYTGPGSLQGKPKQGCPNLPLPSHLLLLKHRGVPRSAERCNHPACLWSTFQLQNIMPASFAMSL